MPIDAKTAAITHRGGFDCEGVGGGRIVYMEKFEQLQSQGDLSEEEAGSLGRVNDVRSRFFSQVETPLDVREQQGMESLKKNLDIFNQQIAALDKEKHAELMSALRMRLAPPAPIILGAAGFLVGEGGSLLANAGALLASLGFVAGTATEYLHYRGQGADQAAEQGNAESRMRYEDKLRDALTELEVIINERRNEVAQALVSDGATWETVTGPDGTTHEELRVTDRQIVHASWDAAKEGVDINLPK